MFIRNLTPQLVIGVHCGTQVPLWFTERTFGVRKNEMIDISHICLSNVLYIERCLFNYHEQATCIAESQSSACTVYYRKRT